jgi:hypothetical protein
VDPAIKMDMKNVRDRTLIFVCFQHSLKVPFTVHHGHINRSV